MTLSDFERGDVRGLKFLADLRNYTLMVRPRMTKFSEVTGGREEYF